MQRLTERAVAADTEGEILNWQQSAADGATRTQLFFVFVMCCESGALRTLERPGDRRSQWVEVADEGTRTSHCRTSRVVVFADLVLRFHHDTLDHFVQKYESSTGTPLAEPLKLVQRRVKGTDVLNHFVMHASRLNAFASVCEEIRDIMLPRATMMNTAQPLDIGAVEKRNGKKGKGKGKKGDKGKGKEKGKQPAESPPGKANENPDKDVECIHCGKKGYRKRECRKRTRDQGSGQEALAEDETPPGCEAHEKEENSWMLLLGLASLHGDDNVEGGRLLIDTGARPSACPPQFCAGVATGLMPGAASFRAANEATIERYGERTIRLQRQETSIDVSFQVADVHIPIISLRDLLDAMCCEVEFSRTGAYIPDGWTALEAGRGTRTVFLDSWLTP